MSERIDVIFVGKWSVGLGENNSLAILKFEFADRAPVNLALSPVQAGQMASEIQNQLSRNRLH